VRQFTLPTLKANLEHGGSHPKAKRKTVRSIDPKRSHHVVLRASENTLLLRSNKYFIKLLLQKLSQRFKVRIYQYSINSNHCHLLVKPQRREGLQNFLRSFTGLVARRVTGARRGSPYSKRFWLGLAYSRVVSWGRAFLVARNYVFKNEMESLGLIPYSRNSPITSRAGPPTGEGQAG